MFAYPEFDSEGKKVLSTAESEMMMDIVTYKMKKGDKKSFCLDKDELALMLVLGAVTFEYEGKKVSAKRGSLFKEGPSTLHVSKGTKVSVTADKDSELLCQSTENDKDFPSKYYAPDD